MFERLNKFYENVNVFLAVFLSMAIDNKLWYARVGLCNVNNNSCSSLRTRHNTTKFFYNPHNWNSPLTIFFTIETIIVFVLPWLVHNDKTHFLNRKNLVTSQKAYARKKECNLSFWCLYFCSYFYFLLSVSQIEFGGTLFGNVVVNKTIWCWN